MNFSTETKTLGFCEINYESTAEQSVEAELLLPDYCPEIKRILKCSVSTDILSVQNSSGRVTAQGNANVRLIYVGENDKTSAYEQVVPIQKTVDSDKLSSGCAVCVKAVTDYVNCRALNSRKVDVRAMLTFVFKSMKKREETVMTKAENAGIMTLSQEYTFSDLKSVTEKAFNLSEVIELDGDKPVIGRILNSSAYIIVKEKKTINNKILIKGDSYIKIHYLSENESSVCCAEHTIPVSQIIEVDGITDTCDVCLNVSVTACEAIPKVDSKGETKLIDISVRASALILAFESVPVTLISDAYSTECLTHNSSRSIEMLSTNTDFDSVFTNKVVLESIGVSVDCIHAVWCSDVKYGYSLKNGKCLFTGSYQATIIFRDSDKQQGIIQKPVDFEFTVDLKEECERITCHSSILLTGCSCSVTGESKIELRTEMNASGKILSSKILKYISEIELLENNSDESDNCALTVYFSDKNEKVWNIAKRYRTTVEAIMAENSLDSDVITEKKTLLIPSVR